MLWKEQEGTELGMKLKSKCCNSGFINRDDEPLQWSGHAERNAQNKEAKKGIRINRIIQPGSGRYRDITEDFRPSTYMRRKWFLRHMETIVIFKCFLVRR